MKFLLSIVLLSLLWLGLNAKPQTQVFGRGECNQPNTEFRRCEYSTRATCLNPTPNSDEFAAHCEDGCFCIDGYYYNSNNECVSLADCNLNKQPSRLEEIPDESIDANGTDEEKDEDEDESQ